LSLNPIPGAKDGKVPVEVAEVTELIPETEYDVRNSVIPPSRLRKKPRQYSLKK